MRGLMTVAAAMAIAMTVSGGLAMRLAYTLSGGITRLLGRFELARLDGRIRLHVPADQRHMAGEVVERRLASLAKVLGVESEVVRE